MFWFTSDSKERRPKSCIFCSKLDLIQKDVGTSQMLCCWLWCSCGTHWLNQVELISAPLVLVTSHLLIERTTSVIWVGFVRNVQTSQLVDPAKLGCAGLHLQLSQLLECCSSAAGMRHVGVPCIMARHWLHLLIKMFAYVSVNSEWSLQLDYWWFHDFCIKRPSFGGIGNLGSRYSEVSLN